MEQDQTEKSENFIKKCGGSERKCRAAPAQSLSKLSGEYLVSAMNVRLGSGNLLVHREEALICK
jgi:hypothetical protein